LILANTIGNEEYEMTLDQIEICIKAAETKNFSKTAEELFTTQPTVSKSIAALESELGVTLFERLPGKRLGLTDAGKMYVGSFTRFKEDFVSTKNKVDRLISNQKNILSLVMEPAGRHFTSTAVLVIFAIPKSPVPMYSYAAMSFPI
jgi:DNA-binding transcriptional LysR family regulator